MKFNPEITLGTIIEIVAFLLVVAGAVKKFGALETKVNMLYDWWMENQIIHPPQPQRPRIRARQEDD